MSVPRRRYNHKSTSELRKIFNIVSLINEDSFNRIKSLVFEEAADPNVQNFATQNTPLHSICSAHQTNFFTNPMDICLQVFQFLVNIPETNLNLFNFDGETVIHTAAECKTTMFLKILLGSGRLSSFNDINVQSLLKLHPAGDTALHIACSQNCGHTDNVSLLLNSGAGCNIQRSNDQYAPIHCAISNIEDANVLIFIISELIRFGARVNLKAEKGITPLHLAVYAKKPYKIYDFLIKNNADLNASNDKGMTALDLAISKKNREAERAIRTRQQQIAFDMTSHPRLGNASIFNGLPRDVHQLILNSINK